MLLYKRLFSDQGNRNCFFYFIVFEEDGNSHAIQVSKEIWQDKCGKLDFYRLVSHTFVQIYTHNSDPRQQFTSESVKIKLLSVRSASNEKTWFASPSTGFH